MRLRTRRLSRYHVILCSLFVVFYGGLMFFFPRPSWPAVSVYDGSLSFDSGQAFADLRSLAEDYPSRISGSDTFALAAQWAADRFRDRDLDPVTDSFPSQAEMAGLAPSGDGAGNGQGGEGASPDPDLELAVNLIGLLYQQLFTPYDQLVAPAEGHNVMAVAPGKTDEVAIVGAHLDSVANSQGADDNASGVATVLELARVLTAGPHNLTYVFVLFDGEETGLWGSQAWARDHIAPDGSVLFDGRRLGTVRLMLNFDCVAWTGGGQPTLTSGGPTHPLVYSTGYHGRSVDLETEAVVSAALACFDTDWPAGRTSLKEQVYDGGGLVASDHLSFLEAGVTGVSFGRANDDGMLNPRVNTPLDKLEEVDAATLGESGRLGETILRTIDEMTGSPSTGRNAALRDSRSFLLHPRGYTPGWMGLLGALVLIAFVGLLGLPGVQAVEAPIGGPGSRAGKEAGWYALAIAWALVLGLGLAVLYSRVVTLSGATLELLWLGLAGVSIIGLAWIRHRSFRATPDARHESNDYLGLALAALGLTGLPLLGTARLVWLLFIPGIALARLRGPALWARVVFRILIIIWSLGWLYGLFFWSQGDLAFVTRVFSLRQGLVLSWHLALGFFVFPVVWEATARRKVAE